MGKEKEHTPVKLIAAVYSNNLPLFEIIENRLSGKLGPVDLKSDKFDFNNTVYYEKEMGPDLKKEFISFKQLIKPDELPDIKLLSNQIEREYSKDGKRQINIDPGYISLGKLVLATTKDYSHRIYLGRGIYAEVTLYYKDNKFNSFDWTYPDYKSKHGLEFFEKVRANYKVIL